MSEASPHSSGEDPSFEAALPPSRAATVVSGSNAHSTLTPNQSLVNCPFEIGEFVIYRPSAIGRDKSVMTDLVTLQPGARYKIARIVKDAYVVLEGFENSSEGGLYWTEFQRAP